MKNNHRTRRVSIDDRFRKLCDYIIQTPEFIDNVSSYTEFTLISEILPSNDVNNFRTIFLSAAKQSGFIEFADCYMKGCEKFRWIHKKELTDEEKSRLYKKILEISQDELNL
jgi:hypothetical protein